MFSGNVMLITDLELMTDEQYGDDSLKMLLQIILLEFQINAHLRGVKFSDEEWFKYLETFNFGRELLDRGFIKMFFGGGPKGINKRIRKALLKFMLKIEKEHPDQKGSNFDSIFKELVSKEF